MIVFLEQHAPSRCITTVGMFLEGGGGGEEREKKSHVALTWTSREHCERRNDRLRRQDRVIQDFTAVLQYTPPTLYHTQTLP